MKPKIKTKNKFTYPIYTVMDGNEVIKSFYSKKEAKEYIIKITDECQCIRIIDTDLWSTNGCKIHKKK